eukprot:SAG31_NODE_12733_length_920_cov_2.294762_1_plen_300_part_10
MTLLCVFCKCRYGPDCGKPIPDGMSGSSGRLGARVGDAPRVEIALPADVGSDAYLTNWVKTQPGPVTFDGTPCSFPGRVWKSKKGSYWNMLCALNGATPWARFTSPDPSLMNWTMADKSFTQGVDKGGDAGALFHKIPGAPAGGPTHMINGPGTGATFLLGKYDAQKEIMTITEKTPQVTVTGSFGWAAAGNDGPDPDSDTGRLLTAAWVTSRPSAISLLRELKWDLKSKQLVSALAPEYEKREREKTQRERDRERQRETERDRERQRQRQRDRERQRETERERQRDRERERQRDRDRER